MLAEERPATERAVDDVARGDESLTLSPGRSPPPPLERAGAVASV